MRRFLERIVGQHPARAAVTYMLISTAGFSLMNVFVRLAAESLSPSLVVTLRNLVTLLILLPFVAPRGFAAVRTARIGDHLRRSMVGAVGMLSWTYAITTMPLTHATALSFTTPLLATIAAMGLLKEHASRRHFLALGVGLIGTLIILRPAAEGFDWHALIVIFATTSWALTSILIKSLTTTERPIAMVFYMNLFMFIIALPLSATGWQWPTPHTWLMIVGIALCSLLMHFTLVKAYSLAPLVTLMPLDFMRLVFTSLLAYFVFGETSDWITWVGSAIIIGSAVFIAPRQRTSAPPEADA